MPYTRRTSRRRPYTRRRFIRRRFMTGKRLRPIVKKNRRSFSRWSESFPSSMLAKLNYGLPNQALTTSTYTSQQFRLNSLFDPEVAIGGGQPRYFDTFCGGNDTSAPYYRYHVFAAKVIVKFWNNSDTSGLIACGWWPSGNSSEPTAPAEILERKSFKWDHLTALSGSAGQKTISFYVPIHVAYGFSRQRVRDDSQFNAAYNASPTQVLNCSVMWFPDVVAEKTVNFSIKIIYYAKFSTLNDISNS